MRILITLALFQTGILLVILFRLPTESPDVMERPASDVSQPADTAMNPFLGRSASDNRQASSTIDDSRLRTIIREELQRAMTASPALSSRPASPGAEIERADPDQRQRIFDQIEYYRSIGKISPQQMNALMRDIARLDPTARETALSRLTTALNRQEIDGRF